VDVHGRDAARPVLARRQEDGFDSARFDDHVTISGNFPGVAEA